jgi:hypothetical protein
MNFNVARTTPGDYKVQVNDLLSKFTVVVPKPEKKEVIEVAELEPTVRLGLLEDKIASKQEEISRQAPTPVIGGFQSAMDKAADSIEHALDKFGDGITYPIAKLAGALTKLSEKKTRK